MVISQNSYPLNILNKLGIAVKPVENDSAPHLPKELGNYLDEIIKSGDQESLYQAADQVINAVENVASENPRVAMNALLAMSQSADSAGVQVGLAGLAGDEGAKQADPRLLQMHSAQKQLYARIANSVGVNDNGLSLEVINREDLNKFLQGLVDNGVELTDADKSFFNNFLKDEFFNLSSRLRDDLSAADAPELFKVAETLKLIHRDLGKANITIEVGGQDKEVAISRLHRGLRGIALDLEANRESTLIEPYLRMIDAIE